MRGRTLVAAAAASLCAGSCLAVDAGAKSRAPARMLVYAQEWSLWPSRTSLPSGRVTLQLYNRGQDAHDLRIRRLDRHGRMTGRAQLLAVTGSGAITQGTWQLRPGRYELYCSIPGHRAHGMHVRLTVR